LAKTGALLFAAALIMPTWVSSLAAQASPAIVAAASEATAALPPSVDPRDATIELPELMPRALAALAEVADAAPPPPEPLTLDGYVLASWYGPGFYGNRTACGQTFSADIIGVAHRTLACGSRVRVTSPTGVSIVVPVIDRGPFVAGRSLDLSSALKAALECNDLCSVRMVVVDH
jgi:rare lipoprotein A (peptidoglycan hydrolase)